MSELVTNKITPSTGSSDTVTLGDSGDTFTVPSGANIVNSGTATGFGGGKVLQVVAVNMTVTSRTTTSGTFVDISGYTADITPSSTDSKILCFAQINHGTSYQHHRAFKLLRDATVIDHTQCYPGGDDLTQHLDVMTMATVDSPATTSAITYKIQWAAYTSGTRYLNINSTSAYTVGPSTLILMELESATVTTVSS